jgi:hypothetical protein
MILTISYPLLLSLSYVTATTFFFSQDHSFSFVLGITRIEFISIAHLLFFSAIQKSRKFFVVKGQGLDFSHR